MRYLAILAILGSVARGASDTTAPSQELTLGAAVTGAASVTSANGSHVGSQSAYEANLTWINRYSIEESPWYAGWGIQSEMFGFSSLSQVGLSQLRNVAANLTVEYYEGREQAASLTLRPGWYFQNRIDSSSWDIPVEIETGIPIARGFDAVIGGSDARLLHHPLPVVGFAWTLSPQIRLEAVYPEPALVWTPRKDLEIRLAGELTGDGFRSGPSSGNTPVEYYSYRVGISAAWTWGRQTLTAGAGVETEREFDFFRQNRHYRAGSAPYAELTWAFR